MSRYAKRAQSGAQSGYQSSTLKSVEVAYLSLLRTQRVLAGMLVVCAVLGTTVFHAAPGTLGSRKFLPVIMATTLLTFAYTTRNSMVLPALAELRRSPGDPKLLQRWSRNNLIVQSLCTLVGLVGFAMQLLGAATTIAFTLYAIAIGYLFLLRPTRP
jgi:hypothetical protein